MGSNISNEENVIVNVSNPNTYIFIESDFDDKYVLNMLLEKIHYKEIVNTHQVILKKYIKRVCKTPEIGKNKPYVHFQCKDEVTTMYERETGIDSYIIEVLQKKYHNDSSHVKLVADIISEIYTNEYIEKIIVFSKQYNDYSFINQYLKRENVHFEIYYESQLIRYINRDPYNT